MTAGASISAVVVALGCNFVMAIAKLVAATWSGSSAILASAVQSLVDASSQALLLHGIRQAARPADARHPLGRAQELIFWSYVAGILLFAMGAGIAINEGLRGLADPRAISSPQLSYGVLAASFVLAGVSIWKTMQFVGALHGGSGLNAVLRTSPDPALSMLLVQGIAGLAGLLITLAGVNAIDLPDVAAADGGAALGTGLILAGVAVFSALQIKRVLASEAATDEQPSASPSILAPPVSAPAQPSRPAPQNQSAHQNPPSSRKGGRKRRRR